jgi:hypothetical protein
VLQWLGGAARPCACVAADGGARARPQVLYNELEAWRLQETRKIKEAGLPKEQEQQVLQQLLHKETRLLQVRGRRAAGSGQLGGVLSLAAAELLVLRAAGQRSTASRGRVGRPSCGSRACVAQTIDRLKINANHENKEARIQHTLNEMSKPKRWQLRNGGKVDVHTPFTTRAKELQQLYNGARWARQLPAASRSARPRERRSADNSAPVPTLPTEYRLYRSRPTRGQASTCRC